jgi:hypothetical protein
MAGSRPHSRNPSQSRRAVGDGDDSVLGAVLDVRFHVSMGGKEADWNDRRANLKHLDER